MEKFNVIRTLGKGSFGEALLAESKGTGQLVVIKSQELKTDGRAMREALLLQKLSHYNVVRYLDNWQEDVEVVPPPPPPSAPAVQQPPTAEACRTPPGRAPEKATHPPTEGAPVAIASPNACDSAQEPTTTRVVKHFIVMEYCNSGDLKQLINHYRALGQLIPEAKIRQWFAQLTCALYYCHSQHILHRDLKSENVLLHDQVVKLADFGLARETGSSTEFACSRVGTPHYISPEISEGSPYNTRSDLWSLGVILFEMMSLRRPFEGKSLQEILARVRKNEAPCLEDLTRNAYSQDLYDICRSLMAKNPLRRPSARELLELPSVQRVFGDIRLAPLSVEQKHREETAWHKVIYKAKEQTSVVLEHIRSFKINIRTAPSREADIVMIVRRGDIVEQLSRFNVRDPADDKTTAWIEVANGYCWAQNEGKEIFRALPLWRVSRPALNASDSSTSAMSASMASPLAILPKSPHSDKEVMDREEMMVDRCLNRANSQLPCDAQHTLSKFLLDKGLDETVIHDLVLKRQVLASPLDDMPWTLYAAEVLRQENLGFCMPIVRSLIALTMK